MKIFKILEENDGDTTFFFLIEMKNDEKHVGKSIGNLPVLLKKIEKANKILKIPQYQFFLPG